MCKYCIFTTDWTSSISYVTLDNTTTIGDRFEENFTAVVQGRECRCAANVDVQLYNFFSACRYIAQTAIFKIRIGSPKTARNEQMARQQTAKFRTAFFGHFYQFDEGQRRQLWIDSNALSTVDVLYNAVNISYFRW